MNDIIEQLLLKTYIDKCAKKYAEFMEIDKLPSFEIITKAISLDTANKKGFGAFAAHSYNVTTGVHSLKVWSELYNPQLNAEYMLFHEFTHILDTDKYVRGDKNQNVAIRGFTEYHAAQVDFMRLLGADKITSKVSFTMNQEFNTVEGRKTAYDFVVNAHNVASSLIARGEFPADIETLSTTLGLIFNYWGRRSICRMYSTDYMDLVDSSEIEKFFGHDAYKGLELLMNGWLSETNINLLLEFYLKMVISTAQKHSL